MTYPTLWRWRDHPALAYILVLLATLFWAGAVRSAKMRNDARNAL